MKLLESKVAIITGGSRGIGKSICETFAQNGCDVAFTYNNSKDSAEALAKELNSTGIKAKSYKSDASNFDDATKLVEDVLNDFGKIDILVNNAGIKKDNLDAIEWAANELDVYLAWSLHSSIPKHRSELMTINDKYPINSLLPKLKKYYEKTKLPIFIEWICLEENMTEEHAKELVKIMKKVPSKLNLIEFNPLENKSFKPASQDNIDKFSKIIQDNGFLSLFRRSRGRDINASCGSLANKKA